MSLCRPLLFSSLLALAASASAVACGSDPATPVGGDAGPIVNGDAGDAGADQAITIGEGSEPGVAIDPAGTAFVAWYGPEPTTNTLQFCRLPRGATACDIRKAIPAPGTTLTRPFVTVSGSNVRVVSYRYGLTGDRFQAIYVFTSTDGGTTFDAGRPIGNVPFRDAIVGPGDALSFVTDAFNEGEVYETARPDATAPPTQHAVLSTDHPYSGAVGLTDAATPLVVFANGSNDAQFRRLTTGDPNSANSWSAPSDLGKCAYMHLASGKSGLVLQCINDGNKLVVRKFDGTTFGAATLLPEGTGELPQSHLAQDPEGRLHAVWPQISTTQGINLRYASSNDGVTWQSDVVLNSLENITSLRVAMAADHIGVIAWSTRRLIRPEVPERQIRVVAIRRPNGS